MPWYCADAIRIHPMADIVNFDEIKNRDNDFEFNQELESLDYHMAQVHHYANLSEKQKQSFVYKRSVQDHLNVAFRTITDLKKEIGGPTYLSRVGL